MVTYELWVGEPEDGYTFIPAGKAQGFKTYGLLSANATKQWEVTAETDTLACFAYHEYMGWETYKPMTDPDCIGECITEYNNLVTANPPPIHEYLGMTEEEYQEYLDSNGS